MFSLAYKQKKNIETRTKAYYSKWKVYQEHLGVTDLPIRASRYKGITFQDLPDYEKCFNIRVHVYSLSEDGTCQRVYQSVFTEENYSARTMYLNLYQNHFSLITNFAAYAKKHGCRFCGRAFTRSYHLLRHLLKKNTRTP